MALTRIRQSNIIQPLDADLDTLSLSANGNITATGDLSVGGNTAITGSLAVDGNNLTVTTDTSSSILTLERTGAGASQLDISLAAQKATFTSSQDGFRFIQGSSTQYEARFGTHVFNDNSDQATLTLANDRTATFSDNLTVSGDLLVSGDFTVSGNTTFINSDNLAIEDLNIVLANGAANSAVADGAGITVDGASATLIYDATYDNWEFNKELRLLNNNGLFWTIAAGGASTGLKTDANDNITFRNGGNWDRLVVANSGLVGISTNDPIQKLDVNGSISLSNSATGSRFIGFYSNVVDSSNNALSAFIEKNGDNFTFYNDDDGVITITNNGVSYIKIDNGFVGVGPNHVNPTAPLSILTTGGNGAPDTLAFDVINNGNSFDINGLAAYNDTTGYDIVQKAALTYHARGQGAGNIFTHISGSSSGTHTDRYVNLNSPQSIYSMSQTSYYQYSGSGNTNTEMAVPEDQILHNVNTYNGGGVDVKFTQYANGDFWAKGAYQTDHVRHSVRPSVLLDFKNAKRLDNAITFTRNSIGTYWDGKTKTRAEQNLVKYSEEFTNGVWAKFNLSVTASATTAPDGTNNATSLIPNTASNNHYIAYNYARSDGFEMTQSWYAKANGYDWCFIGHGISPGEGAWFNLSTGTTGTVGANVTSSTMRDAGNGWYRCSITYTSAIGVRYGIIAPCGSDGVVSFTANGTSGIYVFGAQVEEGSTASGYQKTTATPINKFQPTLMTVQANQPRFDHDPTTGESKGLLIEEARTNLCLYSQDILQNWYQPPAVSLHDDIMVAPDGTKSATGLSGSGTNAQHYILYNVSFTPGTYTTSVYLKAGPGVDTVYMEIGRAYQTVNLATGAISNTGIFGSNWTYVDGGSEYVGNGWWRAWITGTGSASESVPCLKIHAKTVVATVSKYEMFYLWGVQTEYGTFHTSYLPTTGNQVTRPIESLLSIDEDYQNIWELEEWTVYGDFSLDVAKSYNYSRGIWGIGNPNSTYQDSISVYYNANNNNLTLQLYENGDGWVSASIAAGTSDSARFAWSYSLTDNAIAVNGTIGYTSTGVAPQSRRLDRFILGNVYNSGSSFALNGHLRKLAIYSDRLPNEELVALTEA